MAKKLKLDLDKFKHLYDFDLETEKLGTIRCGSFSIKALAHAERHLKTENPSSDAFAREMFGKVGRRVKIGGEFKEENRNSSQLSESELSQISDEEVETFAGEFVKHNKWLLENHDETNRSVSKEKDGEKDVSLEYVFVDFPKEEKESNSDYFVRVIKRHMDEQVERWEKTFKPYKGLLSSVAEGMLKNHLSLSDQLQNTLHNAERNAFREHVARITPTPPREFSLPPIPENPIHDTNRRLDNVLNHAEALKPVIFQSAELFRNMSDTALQMHADFNRSARTSTIFSFAVIVIAAISLVITAVYSWWSYESTQQQGQLVEGLLKAQQTQIDSITKGQEERTERVVGAMQAEQAQLSKRQVEAQQSHIQTLIARQDAQIERLIESLRSDQNQSQEDIQNLTKAISDVLITRPSRGELQMVPSDSQPE